MIWTPPLRHLNDYKFLNRPSHEPQKDWRRHRGDSHRECKQPLGYGLAPKGWHKPPGRSQRIAASLIPTGVWCDSVRNQQSEKTGAIRVCRNEGGWRCCTVLTQLVCDDLVLPLTPAG